MEFEKIATLKPREMGIKLTFQEIHDKIFESTFRGYDQNQVNEFLDIFIKDYDLYNQIIRTLQEKIMQLQKSENHSKNTQEDILRRIRELETFAWGSPKA